MIKFEERNGRDCVFCKIYKQQGENDIIPQARLECNNPKISLKFMEKINWDIEKCVKSCKHFKSIMIESRCYTCGKELKVKKSSWSFWVMGDFEDFLACSKKCQKRGQKHMDFEPYY